MYYISITCLHIHQGIFWKAKSQPFVTVLILKVVNMFLFFSNLLHHPDWIYFNFTSDGREFTRQCDFVHNMANHIIKQRKETLVCCLCNKFVLLTWICNLHVRVWTVLTLLWQQKWQLLTWTCIMSTPLDVYNTFLLITVNSSM